MPDLLSRYLNQPAKRCSRCGSDAFRLTPAGALCCVVCTPGESSAVLIAKPDQTGFKLHWELWSEDFDGPLPSPALLVSANLKLLAAESWGVLGGGVGLSGGTAGACGLIDPESPPVLLVVSTRLDWFVAPLGSLWAGDMEVIGEIPGWPPAGAYRPLNQLYLGWLVGRLDAARAAGKLRGQDLDDGRAALRDVAVDAVHLGVLGEWALDISRWPVRAPGGYVGPQSIGPIRLIEWTDEFG